ncbi:hypothetical protein VKI21_18500 [Cyanobacterium aponinum UTEX 3222]|uniref:hypothetical protein n=1 Tax=Cyanobacterium aponinum TaxID=379064 RepID=UPI0030912294|nr:hypothetical protein VKI21_18500 [Cyanobacterium aponinum UTEX 3222]
MGSEERQKLLILLSIYEVRNIANNREEGKTITQTIGNIKYNLDFDAEGTATLPASCT